MVNCVTKIKIVHFQACPEFVIYGQKTKLWPTVMTTGNGKLKIANLSAAKVSHTSTENVETLGNDHKWKLFSLIFTMLCCPHEWLVMTENQVRSPCTTIMNPREEVCGLKQSFTFLKVDTLHLSKGCLWPLFNSMCQVASFSSFLKSDQKLRENKLVTVLKVNSLSDVFIWRDILRNEQKN